MDSQVRSRWFASLKDTLSKGSIDLGTKHLPRVTRVLTKEPEPEFQSWAERFIVIISITFVIVNSFQFIDIFSTNLNAILGFHFIRMILLLTVGVMPFMSIGKGWRKAEINITFQIIIVVVTMLVTLGAGISKGVLFSRSRKKTFFHYFSVILPFLQLIVSAIGLVSLIRLRMGGAVEAPIAMGTMLFFIVLAIGYSLVQIFNVSVRLYTGVTPETSLVSKHSTNSKEGKKQSVPLPLVNPINEILEPQQDSQDSQDSQERSVTQPNTIVNPVD
jgi:hypothetical protein